MSTVASLALMLLETPPSYLTATASTVVGVGVGVGVGEGWFRCFLLISLYSTSGFPLIRIERRLREPSWMGGSMAGAGAYSTLMGRLENGSGAGSFK